MKTALIIDDHPITHVGASLLLAELGYGTVVKALTRDQAFDVLRETNPDLILLDLNMPGADGLAMIAPLKRKLAKTPILVFTMNDSTSAAARAIDAGASGFLSKEADPDDFIDAVRTLEAGEFYLSRRQAIELATLRKRGDPVAHLTPREREVLRLIGEGRSYQEMADTLSVSYKTVANTTTTLRRKLNIDGSAALMRMAIDLRP